MKQSMYNVFQVVMKPEILGNKAQENSVHILWNILYDENMN